MRKLLLGCALVLSTGCVTASPTQYSLPADLPNQCEKHCDSMGMRLSAIVIIVSNSGCVCEPRKQDDSQVGGASAAAGGAAVQAVLNASQQSQQAGRR